MKTANHFVIRKAADTDLREIYRYSENEFGVKRAVAYIEKLATTFQHLADNPRMRRCCCHINQIYMLTILNRILSTTVLLKGKLLF